MHRGRAFSLVGMILGIVSAAISITAIVFSMVSLLFAKRYKKPNIRQ